MEADAETHLAGLLDRIERGETITVTRNGEAVARIVPVTAPRPSDVDRTLAEIEAFRNTVQKGSLDELLSARHEGHHR